jgi:Rv0078B-related antitoxin
MEEPIHPGQLDAFRRATPAQKLAAVAALYEAGIQLRVAGLRMTHPDWTDAQRDFEARRSLRHAGT